MDLDLWKVEVDESSKEEWDFKELTVVCLGFKFEVTSLDVPGIVTIRA